MITEELVADSFSLTPSAVIEVFVLDISGITQDLDESQQIMRFYNGNNFSYTPLYWQGKEYTPLPIEVEDFNFDSQRPSRPKIRVANIEGAFSRIIKRYGGIEGAELTRKRTLLKYIDNRNFGDGQNPYGVPDPNSAYEDDIYKVEKKIAENPIFIEYELANPIDLENTRFPSSQVLANVCPYAATSYRGEGCKYSGLVLTNKNGESISPIKNANAWNANKYYETEGEYVHISDFSGARFFKYISTDKTIGQHPATSPNYWEPVTAKPYHDGVPYSKDDIVYKYNDRKIKVFAICLKDHTSSQPHFGFYNKNLWERDVCPGTIKACSKKQGTILSYGGYRGTSILPF